jgi:hypothetical protein
VGDASFQEQCIVRHARSWRPGRLRQCRWFFECPHNLSRPIARPGGSRGLVLGPRRGAAPGHRSRHAVSLSTATPQRWTSKSGRPRRGRPRTDRFRITGFQVLDGEGRPAAVIPLRRDVAGPYLFPRGRGPAERPQFVGRQSIATDGIVYCSGIPARAIDPLAGPAAVEGDGQPSTFCSSRLMAHARLRILVSVRQSTHCHRGPRSARSAGARVPHFLDGVRLPGCWGAVSLDHTGAYSTPKSSSRPDEQEEARPRDRVQTSSLGDGVRHSIIPTWSNLYGCAVGARVRASASYRRESSAGACESGARFCTILPATRSSCEGGHLEDGVFVGHGAVMVTNDLRPRRVWTTTGRLHHHDAATGSLCAARSSAPGADTIRHSYATIVAARDDSGRGPGRLRCAVRSPATCPIHGGGADSSAVCSGPRVVRGVSEPTSLRVRGGHAPAGPRRRQR